VDGHQGNPIVDPASGVMCWLAVACRNPKCPGKPDPDRPHVFMFEEPGYRADPSGEIAYTPERRATPGPATTLPCPECGQTKFLSQYLPTQTVQRQANLKRELNAVRGVRSKP
jgi:hypothetical protein